MNKAHVYPNNLYFYKYNMHFSPKKKGSTDIPTGWAKTSCCESKKEHTKGNTFKKLESWQDTRDEVKMKSDKRIWRLMALNNMTSGNRGQRWLTTLFWFQMYLIISVFIHVLFFCVFIKTLFSACIVSVKKSGMLWRNSFPIDQVKFFHS